MSSYLSDEALSTLKEVMMYIADTALRPQLMEITVLSMILEGLKAAHPEDAVIVAQHLEELRNNADIKKIVDVKIEAIKKVFRSLDGPNRDRVLQDIFRLYERQNRAN